jgi:hypothetical protein
MGQSPNSHDKGSGGCCQRSAWGVLENEKKTILAEMAEKLKVNEAEEQHKVNEKNRYSRSDNGM